MTNVSIIEIDDLCRTLFELAGKNTTNPLCCSPSYDGFRNWTFTMSNTVATQRCPGKSLDPNYNDKENITRICLPNGVWAKKSNYDRCIIPSTIKYHVLATWFVGYTISTIALLVALVLFRYFRSLRCIRNDIHCNLIVSYIVRVFAWYLVSVPQITTSDWPITVVNITTIILLFSQASNYLWMFVEGLYLLIIIVWTYGIDKFKMWHYSLIGWGFPTLLSSTLAISIALTEKFSVSWFTSLKANPLKLYIIHVPILISIIVNIFVLAVIIYTVFNKLKQTKVPITRRSSKLSLFSTEYRKAIKAAAVLIPLLGIAHILFMFEFKGLIYPEVYKTTKAILTSTQGFFVALIYCFLNREVKFVIKAKYRSFRGYLPSASRTRQTLDDSIGPVRRGNSAFRPLKQDSDNNVFKCRTYRSQSNNNGNNAKPVIPKLESNVENKQE